MTSAHCSDNSRFRDLAADCCPLTRRVLVAEASAESPRRRPWLTAVTPIGNGTTALTELSAGRLRHTARRTVPWKTERGDTCGGGWIHLGNGRYIRMIGEEFRPSSLPFTRRMQQTRADFSARRRAKLANQSRFDDAVADADCPLPPHS